MPVAVSAIIPAMELHDITDRLRFAFDAHSEQTGLSQADLARRLGVTRATVGDWLHGRSVHIRPEHIFTLADALGIEPRWLATGQGPREAVPMTRDQRSLLHAYHALPEPERIAIRSLVLQIAESRTDYQA